MKSLVMVADILNLIHTVMSVCTKIVSFSIGVETVAFSLRIFNVEIIGSSI